MEVGESVGLSPVTRRKAVDWLSETDTDRLFRDHSIDEIRRIEKKIRGDIERKKEDLRQMVGERYRDLIDAADTITAMQLSSSEVVNGLNRIKENCSKIESMELNYSMKGKLGKKSDVGSGIGKTSSTFYSIATQMKLLVDIPEKIWSTSDKKKFLDAALLYLLARQIVDNLQKSMTSPSVKDLLASFPILPRQWSTISHYVISILQDIRERLKHTNLPELDIAECLCAILLLDDHCKLPRQAFKEFLIAREVLLETLLYSDEHTSSIKLQIRDVVSVIRLTIRQIYKLFYTDSSEEDQNITGLLFTVLRDITSKDDCGASDVLNVLIDHEVYKITIARHLPQSVLTLKPRISTTVSNIQVEDIRESCQEWISTILQDVLDGVSKLLAYVSSIKRLMAIRDAVWELLTNEERNESDGSPDWDTICEAILGRKMSIWDEFLRGIFFDRAKTIAQGMFDGAFNSTEDLITSDLDAMNVDQNMLCDRDMSMYIWHESSFDMPTANTWSSSTDSERSNEEPGGLTLKSRAYTPSVYRLCRKFDSKLRKILHDCRYCIENNDASSRISVKSVSDTLNFSMTQTPPSPMRKEVIMGAFDKFAGANEMKQFMRSTCEDCIRRIARKMNDELDLLHTSLKVSDDEVSDDQVKRALSVDRVLLLGRVARALIEQCPSIQEFMTISLKNEVNTLSKGHTTRPSFTYVKSKSVPMSMSMEFEKEQLPYQSLLMDTYSRAYSIWIEWISDLLLKAFRDNLFVGDESLSLAAASKWEKITIEEVSETGSTVESKISIPAQVSCYIMLLLFGLCEELNRVGGHAIDRSVLQRLIRRVSNGIYEVYEDYIRGEKTDSERNLDVDNVLSDTDEALSTDKGESKITQTRAIQFLFDIRFISNVLNCQSDDMKMSKESYERERILIGMIESFIDPFDLDVFTPYITSNLNRFRQRCMAMLGCLTSISSQSPIITTDKAIPATGQESHNILPLSEASVRFSLLPYSASTRNKKKAVGKRERKISEVASNYTEAYLIPEATANLFKRVELLANYGIFDDDTNTG